MQATAEVMARMTDHDLHIAINVITYPCKSLGKWSNIIEIQSKHDYSTNSLNSVRFLDAGRTDFITSNTFNKHLLTKIIKLPGWFWYFAKPEMM